MATERGTWTPAVLLQAHRRARMDQADALRLRAGGAIAPVDSLDVEQCTRLLRHVREELGEIDAATARVRSGCYGRCESCALPIPLTQLLARPHARYCSPCGSVGSKAGGTRTAPAATRYVRHARAPDGERRPRRPSINTIV